MSASPTFSIPTKGRPYKPKPVGWHASAAEPFQLRNDWSQAKRRSPKVGGDSGRSCVLRARAGRGICAEPVLAMSGSCHGK